MLHGLAAGLWWATDVDLRHGAARFPVWARTRAMVPLPRTAAGMVASSPRDQDNPRVVTGKKPGTHLADLHHPWRHIRARAGLGDVRIHDLRHSFALRVGAGREPADDRGKLLRTRARYAHPAWDLAKASASKIADGIGSDIPAKNPDTKVARS